MLTLPALTFELLNVKPYCAALPIPCFPALSRYSRAPCCWSLLPKQVTAQRHSNLGCRISAEHHRPSALRHPMPPPWFLHSQALCTKTPFQEGLGQQGRMLGEIHPCSGWRTALTFKSVERNTSTSSVLQLPYTSLSQIRKHVSLRLFMKLITSVIFAQAILSFSVIWK